MDETICMIHRLQTCIEHLSNSSMTTIKNAAESLIKAIRSNAIMRQKLRQLQEEDGIPEQKISKLEQFFSKIIDVQVFLKLENAGQVRDKIVEIKLNLPGKSILIKEIAQTFEAGIDLATEALKRQLVRFKEKKNN